MTRCSSHCSDESKFLIVTEGSSDFNILKTALPLVARDVADFFNFVDMKDNYPFRWHRQPGEFLQGPRRHKCAEQDRCHPGQ